MASKRKVSQDDLRKLMANMKSNPSVSNKKLKLSSKELALIEEEKRQKELWKQQLIAQYAYEYDTEEEENDGDVDENTE